MVVFFHYIKENIFLSPARKNKLIMICLLLAFVLVLLMAAWLYWGMKPGSIAEEDSFIPLHYNIYIGIDMWGKWYNVFIFPALGFFVLLINGVLSFLLYPDKEMLCYFLAVFTLFTEIILVLSALMVLLMNS